MVTHPDINPVQQGLTSVNKRERGFPFGDSQRKEEQDDRQKRQTISGKKGFA